MVPMVAWANINVLVDAVLSPPGGSFLAVRGRMHISVAFEAYDL
jgi:hypothetical protein